MNGTLSVFDVKLKFFWRKNLRSLVCLCIDIETKRSKCNLIIFSPFIYFSFQIYKPNRQCGTKKKEKPNQKEMTNKYSEITIKIWPNDHHVFGLIVNNIIDQILPSFF